MYARAPKPLAGNAFSAGLAAAAGTREVEVWPENWPAFCLFCDLQTQWRSGGMGLIGLDYNVLNDELDDMDLMPEQRREYKADIRILEYAALEAMNEKDD